MSPCRLPAVVVALLVAVTGCLPNSRSGDFACASSADCAEGRTCAASGFCVLVDAGRADAAVPACGASCTSVGGTCLAGTCTFTCNEGSCTTGVLCPAGIPCEVSCTGTGSCSTGVACGSASRCEVTCTGLGACSGPIACGANRCAVTCTGDNSCGSGISCSQACACDVTCTGTNACGSGAQCAGPMTCDTGLGCSSSAANPCNTCGT